MNHRSKIIYFVIVFLVLCNGLNAQILLKGKVISNDSTQFPISQVLIINRGNNVGTISDVKGNFILNIDSHAVIIFKKMGFENDTLYIKYIRDETKNGVLNKNIYMKSKPILLPTFTLNYKKVTIDPVARRQEWSYVLDRPMASAQSPITAMYQMFSKKGKELRKLEELYEEEERRRYVEERFGRFRAMLMTGLSGKTLDVFLIHCRPSYEFMLLYNDYDLYERINRCYEEYKILHPEILKEINFKRNLQDSTSNGNDNK